MSKFGANLKRADPSMYRNHCFEPCQKGQICSGFALLQATSNPSMRCNPVTGCSKRANSEFFTPILKSRANSKYGPEMELGPTYWNWRQNSKFARNEHRHHPLPEQVGVQPLANMRESDSPHNPMETALLCAELYHTGRVGPCQKGAVTKEGECASALSA